MSLQDERLNAPPNSRTENHRSPIRCLVIEPDENIRWQLSFLLQNTGIWQIVSECLRMETGLARLDALATTTLPVEIVLLGLGLETPDRIAPLVESIRAVAPTTAIVVLGQLPTSNRMMSRLGIAGYWWKGDRPEILLALMTELAQSPGAMTRRKPSRIVVTPEIAALVRLSQAGHDRGNWLAVDPRLALFDRTLADLNLQLRSKQLSRLNRSILEGRIREIQTARWIVQQILPKSPRIPNLKSPLPASSDQNPTTQDTGNLVPVRSTPPEPGGTLATQPDLMTVLFDHLMIKLAALNTPEGGAESRLVNRTPHALELDALLASQRYALLTVTAKSLQAEVNHLKQSQIRIAQLNEQALPLLKTVWETVVQQYFLPDVDPASAHQAFNLAPALLKSRDRMSAVILQRIPLVPDWLSYVLYQTPLTLDNRPYPAGTPEAEQRALILLENMVVQLANAVLNPLINQFSDVEAVKGRFFEAQYASNRTMTRFRNDLSWRYRRDRWFDTPADIFESQYRLLYLTIRGIQDTNVYAPRQTELQSLTGFPLVVTLALETRDALSPRVRSALSILGSGVVYVLTEVVGRGIGLVGRGIVKGIGNAWQEKR